MKSSSFLLKLGLFTTLAIVGIFTFSPNLTNSIHDFVINTSIVEHRDNFTPATTSIKQSAKSGSAKNEPQVKCGLILFMHINQCAGGSLAHWFEAQSSGYHLLQDMYSWMRVPNASKLIFSWEKMARRANSFVKKVSSTTGWKVLELHHGFPGVYYSQKHIQHWKDIVEGKGCAFHQTTMLRDPVERFISNVNKNSPPMNDIVSFMESRKNWLSRYFLFGICGYYNNKLGCGFDPKTNFTITPYLNENNLNEAINIMSGFDSVGFTDKFSEYMENIKTRTGWKDHDVKEPQNIKSIHKSQKRFNISQSLLERFLEINREDYILYYTMKYQIKKHF